MQQKPVTILKDADGKAVGVMVETLDERFALELHPIDGGKEYPWDKAMARLKELGKEGFNVKQGKIIAVYHEEIDAALEEAGGDKLGWEWAVGEYTGLNAWIYYPTYGALNYGGKSYSCQVRPLLAQNRLKNYCTAPFERRGRKIFGWPENCPQGAGRREPPASTKNTQTLKVKKYEQTDKKSTGAGR